MVMSLLCLLLQDPVKLEMKVGIVGGIKAPEVRLSVEINADKERVTVRMMKLDDRRKEAVRTGTMARKEFDELLKAIGKIWDLPKEDPEGCEDIYGLDTSVSIEQGKKQWRNGGPGGCVHSTSKIQATDEQKKHFAEIVKRLTEAGEKFAVQ